MKYATLCYLMSEGKTLMLLRGGKKDAEKGDMHDGKYVAPGGKREEGETPLVCVKREMNEETGYDVSNLELIATIKFSNKGRIFSDGKTREDYFVHIFKATKYLGILKQPREGTLEWIADESILNLPMWDADKIFTEWIYQGKKFNAEFRQPKGKPVEYDVNFI